MGTSMKKRLKSTRTQKLMQVIIIIIKIKKILKKNARKITPTRIGNVES